MVSVVTTFTHQRTSPRISLRLSMSSLQRVHRPSSKRTKCPLALPPSLYLFSFSAFLLPLPPLPLFPPLAASRFGRFGGEGARCPRRGFEVGADVIGTGLGRPSFFFRCRRRHWRSVWEEMGRRVPLPPLLNTRANELAASFTQLPFPPSGSRMESYSRRQRTDDGGRGEEIGVGGGERRRSG